MKKKILWDTFLCCCIGIVFLTFIFSVIIYQVVSRQTREELRTSTQDLAKNLLIQEDITDYLIHMNYSPEHFRVTLIDDNGVVLYDSYEDQETLDNHLGRKEIRSALETGTGEDKRYSETLGKETFYYAIRVNTSAIIRGSKTVDSIWQLFLSGMVFLLLAFVLSFAVSIVVSRNLATRIVKPINELNLDGQDQIIYDELKPLVDRIVSQRIQIQQQFHEMEQRTNTINAIMKDMQEGLIIIDSDGVILSANKSALIMLDGLHQDYTRQNIIQLTRHIVLLEHVNNALSGLPVSDNLLINQRTISFFASPVWDGEKISGAVLLFIDVSEKADAEKMRREFSANVSHELKTPLTTILGYAEMIHVGMVKSEDVRMFSGKIKTEVERLILLINDIIKLSELDEQPMPRNLQQFDLQALMEEAVVICAPKAEANGIQIQFSQQGVEFYGEKTMIQELLVNLIDNSIKYNQKDGSIDITIKREKEFVHITVSDTGIGIPQDQLERVFERFYRVDPSRSKKTGGTGLGLSIVKHVAKYHQGSVQIDSQIGSGTTVIVKLKDCQSYCK